MTATLFDWAGGMEAIDALAAAFYARARVDDELVVLFGDMPEEHPHQVAVWLAEVMGGPDAYTREHGGYAHMLAKHLGLAITPAQRARWVTLISAAADDAGLPDDPEFRSAFMAYVEWGTRLAMENSQPGADPPREAPVPRWGWGEAPPYVPGA